MNNNNLISLNKRNELERKYICSLGGKARQEQIKRRKLLKKQLYDYMEKEDIIDFYNFNKFQDDKTDSKKLGDH